MTKPFHERPKQLLFNWTFLFSGRKKTSHHVIASRKIPSRDWSIWRMLRSVSSLSTFRASVRNCGTSWTTAFNAILKFSANANLSKLIASFCANKILNWIICCRNSSQNLSINCVFCERLAAINFNNAKFRSWESHFYYQYLMGECKEMCR